MPDPAEAPPSAVAVPARILIVEDEYLIALDAEQVVLMAGHVVVGMARTAEDAVSLAEAEKPDLVLMDIRLASSRDGIDAAIEIRQRFDIPCLIVSGQIDPATRQRARPANPCGFVVKPFTQAGLTPAIADALKKA